MPTPPTPTNPLTGDEQAARLIQHHLHNTGWTEIDIEIRHDGIRLIAFRPTERGRFLSRKGYGEAEP